MILSYNQLYKIRNFLTESYISEYNQTLTPFKNIITYSNSEGLISIPIFINYFCTLESSNVISKYISYWDYENATVYSVFSRMRRIPANSIREIKVKNKESYSTYYIANGFIANSDFNVILAVCKNYNIKSECVHHTLYISTKVFNAENCIEKYIKNTIIQNIDSLLDFEIYNVQLVDEMPFAIFTPNPNTLLNNENSNILDTATRVLNNLE